MLQLNYLCIKNILNNIPYLFFAYTNIGEKMKKFLKVLLPLLVCIIISSLFVYFGKVNYSNIVTPKFAPPGFIFPIVWSIIYLIFYLCMSKTYNDKKTYKLYLIILAMHILWNFLFFKMGFFLIALIELIILYFTSWVFVYYLSLNKKLYFYINIPYLLWLLIATYLNIGIMLLN